MKKQLTSYVLIIAGAILASFSVACILLPNDAIDYGTAGIGIIINKLTGYNLSLCVFAVFLPFIIAGAVFLGKKFFFKALAGSVVYMVGLELFEEFSLEISTEHFIAAAIGGAILGFGLSLILRFGGCIDGSEILANIIVTKIAQKTNRNISLTGILIAFNACVYVACFFLIDKNSAMLSIIVYVVATMVIDHFTDRFEAIKQVTIITKEPDEIIRRLRSDMNKTCTVMESTGAIAGGNKTLICYVSYFELQKVRELIDDFEGGAFVTVSTVDEIIN